MIATKVAAKGFYTKTEVNSMISALSIPSMLSQLSQDADHRTVSDAEKTKWNKSFSGNYNDLANKPTIPTKLSQLTEDNSHVTVTKAQRDKIDTFTGGTSITVDAALSATSTNPVQNKIIKSELDKKANSTDLGVKKITHTASDINVTVNSGEYHVFPTMSSLTITLGTVGTNHMFICGFEFTSGSTPTSLTLKGCTLSNSDDVTSGTYEVNILGTSAIVRLR